MNNKVVYTIYQSFVSRGFSTLRFNFRGVGRSQGKYDAGEDELSDAASCLDYCSFTIRMLRSAGCAVFRLVPGLVCNF